MSKAKSRVPVKVEDARKKQVEEGLSKRDFFDKYGFVLFEHPTKMAAEDWLKHSSVAGVERKPEPGEASPVREIYTKELEPLVTHRCSVGREGVSRFFLLVARVQGAWLFHVL